MEIQDMTAILMVEPTGLVSTEPVVDELTRKMAAAWRNRRNADRGYRGWHTCSCGAHSSNRDHWVMTADGRELLTNSLCVHYLAYHRDDISDEELSKVRSLSGVEQEPTTEEMCPPRAPHRR